MSSALYIGEQPSWAGAELPAVLTQFLLLLPLPPCAPPVCRSLWSSPGSVPRCGQFSVQVLPVHTHTSVPFELLILSCLSSCWPLLSKDSSLSPARASQPVVPAVSGVCRMFNRRSWKHELDCSSAGIPTKSSSCTSGCLL